MKMKRLLSTVLCIAVMICAVNFVAEDNANADESPWHSMYDFEVDSLPSYVSKGDTKAIGVAAISSDVPNCIDKSSQKALRIYTDSGSMQPQNSLGTPVSITLDSELMKTATGLRVEIGANNNMNVSKNYYYGVRIDGKYYYREIKFRLINTSFNYFYFLNETFVSFDDASKSITITRNELRNIEKICSWVYVSGALYTYIDNIEYSTDEQVGADETKEMQVNVTRNTPYVQKREADIDKSKENIAIFLIIGQSNFTMPVGFNHEVGPVNKGTMDDFSDDVTMPEKNTVFSSLYKQAITKLDDSTDATNLISTRTDTDNVLCGVTPSFAKEWYDKTGEKVVLVQGAVGETCMHQWVPDMENYTCKCGRTVGYLDLAISNLKTSFNALKDDYNITHCGYVWNQGENDQLYYNNTSSTIRTEQNYYDAYMSMSNAIFDTGLIDFGSIVPVRNRAGNACSATATSIDARANTIARSAQYRICNDVNNIYMVSRGFEQATGDDMLAGDWYIHCKQSTYNRTGKNAADNLLNSLEIGENSAKIDGMDIYDNTGKILYSVDNNADFLSGDELFAKNTVSSSKYIQIALMDVTSNYHYDITVDGKSGYVDDFGFVDWDKLYEDGICMVKFKVNFTDATTKISGDANEDGKINIKDLLVIKKYLAKTAESISNNADVNGDTLINSTDTLLFKKFLAGFDIKLI